MSDRKTQPASLIAIGRVVGAHGIRGEIKVWPLTDFPAERFQPGAAVYLGAQDDAVAVEIAAARPHKGTVLVKLGSVPDRNAAELLRDQYLLIPEDHAMPLGEHENYCHDLIGLDVQTTAGEPLGRLTEVLFTGANDVYVVARPAGELLLPALRDVIVRVDLDAGVMTVALPPGLDAWVDPTL